MADRQTFLYLLFLGMLKRDERREIKRAFEQYELQAGKVTERGEMIAFCARKIVFVSTKMPLLLGTASEPTVRFSCKWHQTIGNQIGCKVMSWF